MGREVYPDQDLAAVANGSAAGTTFCVHDGNYKVSDNIEVQDGDSFVGVYSDESRPVITTETASTIFDAMGSHEALIKGLQISGAVGDDSCEPACGRGIGGGTNLTVEDVRATGNENQGIGGAGPGLLVKDSLMDHNGSYSFTDPSGPVSAAGIKSVNSMTILNSTLVDNYWVGVWCDLECGSFTVKNSTVTGNGKAGIHDEVSSGPALFVNNTIKNNGVLPGANRHTGLLIVSSAGVNAYDNTFGSNVGYGFQVLEDPRSPDLSAVRVHHNKMRKDRLSGCGLGGVRCYRN